MTSRYSDDSELAAELRALRPTPRPEFTAELDARAEAGFPRRPPSLSSAPGRALSRLRDTPPRRLLLPAGSLAVVAVAVATAVIATGNGHNPGAPVTTLESGPTAPNRTSPSRAAAGVAEAGSTEFEARVPSHSGPYASHHHDRDIERSASITLGDKPSRVRSDASQVFETVHAANGIVLRSAIRDGSAGEAGADFELLIPTARLGDAMATFSAIAEVRSRHESTADITAPTVSAQERLQDSTARARSLLAQLAAAETDSARATAEAELRAERRRMTAIRSQLHGLERRANLSHVSLRIETDASSQGGGGWGIGNGFDDAGRILAIAAGVSVIGLAALAPLALLGLLAWLAQRAWLHRSRRRALAQ